MSASAVGHRFLLTGVVNLPNKLPAVSRRPLLPLLRRKLVREGGGGGGLSCKAAASPSFSGSGAEYSEQLLGARKQKRGKIAGVDQDEIEDPAVLADPDSCFCEFKGVKIHHKICDAELEEQNSVPSNTSLDIPAETRKLGFPMILLHGFGASTFSWNPVMKPLAKLAGSKVLAFDRPAFGLTSRVDPFKHSYGGNEASKPLNPYSLAFSVMATLYFIDFLSAQKVILVGHSAGSLVSVDTYFEAPERIAAMILVAPAIVAPPPSQKVSDENDQTQEASPNSNIRENPVIRFFSILANFSRYIAQSIMDLMKRMVNLLNSLYKKALSAFLRSYIAAILVRIAIDKFGTTGIRSAWYDAKKVTEGILDGYTKPLRIKGWDRALLEFTAAMLTDSEPESKPPLAKRLKQIRCPVLIVTGDSDRLVPSWNSERLSQAIPGSRFEVIKNCGHLPQEERPEEFVSVVNNFLQSIFGGLEAERLQAAT